MPNRGLRRFTRRVRGDDTVLLDLGQLGGGRICFRSTGGNGASFVGFCLSRPLYAQVGVFGLPERKALHS
jgi:hypothetical protein